MFGGGSQCCIDSKSRCVSNWSNLAKPGCVWAIIARTLLVRLFSSLRDIIHPSMYVTMWPECKWREQLKPGGVNRKCNSCSSRQAWFRDIIRNQGISQLRAWLCVWRTCKREWKVKWSIKKDACVIMSCPPTTTSLCSSSSFRPAGKYVETYLGMSLIAAPFPTQLTAAGDNSDLTPQARSPQWINLYRNFWTWPLTWAEVYNSSCSTEHQRLLQQASSDVGEWWYLRRLFVKS